MKNSLIILAAMLALPFAALRAQTEDEQETVEFQPNDQYSISARKISASEYYARKNESEHLRHKPYKVITDSQEAQKRLGRKIKLIEVQEWENIKYFDTEITFKDGTKRRVDRTFAIGFRAYFPELNILLYEGEALGDYMIDLNDSRSIDMHTTGNPYNHAVSPDKQLRINGYYIGGASEGSEYWLEKWNPKKKQYEFVRDFEGDVFYLSRNWFWTSNSTALFQYGWWEKSAEFYEMEIIINN